MVIEYENHFQIFWFVQLRVRTVSSSYGHLCERADPQFNQYRGRKKVFDKTPITEDTMNNDFPLPYEGVRVLDVSQGFAGPYCAALLAAQGANVVKVEPPRGDWIREIGEAYDGITPWTVVANSGKRSICIDATQPQGRALLQRLANGVDVMVQNFRPGVIERLGVGYTQLSAGNPGLVFVSITGFGSEEKRAGSDSVFQAFTGIAYSNRDNRGTPRRLPILLPDTITGIYAAQAVGGALFARGRTGRGRHLQISLLESCAALQSASILDDALANGAERLPSTVPFGVFRSRDGYLTVTSMSDAMFVRLLRTAGLDDWVDDNRCAGIAQRQQHAGAINDAIAKKLLERSNADWILAFTGHDVLCSEVLDYAAFRATQQAIATGAFADIEQSPYGVVPVARMPGAAREWPVAPCPYNGEHTRDVLAEVGVNEDEFSRLAAAGTVFQRPVATPDLK
jgi:crotonobetainyl-CoA:carnitine CoA-transferase CaiB-like acyl-CoA transferase